MDGDTDTGTHTDAHADTDSHADADAHADAATRAGCDGGFVPPAFMNG